MQILFEVVERFDVGVHALLLRVGDEDHAVHTFQNQFARGVVENLSRHGVEMKARFEAAHCAKFQRHEVEEERAVGFGRQADELAFRLRSC